ncbi:hypothetical protein SDC9_139014 [bioreactor metagenome]|uniref:Uncharacterized protein n=1 Tax=bioreactor metagenome TaxID=1076179 RepID=A0A645DQX2_9ZZZZ
MRQKIHFEVMEPHTTYHGITIESPIKFNKRIFFMNLCNIFNKFILFF